MGGAHHLCTSWQQQLALAFLRGFGAAFLSGFAAAAAAVVVATVAVLVLAMAWFDAQAQTTQQQHQLRGP